MSGVSISVVGSVNLDIVARAERLPAPGETVTGATLAKYPGGKGANIALAAQRLGAKASLIARVGDDPEAEAALRLLKAGGVDLSACEALADVGTGVALIAVSEGGENQIIVASGANDRLLAEAIPPLDSDATLCVLEVPVDAVLKAGEQTRGFFAVNLAPALPVPDALIARADLLIVNEGEAAVYGDQLATARQVAVTHGARGAVLMAEGHVIAEAPPPPVTPVDTTGAGDTFSAALTLALCEGQSPQAALKFAVTAGALTTTQAGAQPSFPVRGDVDRLLQA